MIFEPSYGSSWLRVILLVEELVCVYSDKEKQEHGADSEQCRELEIELEVSFFFLFRIFT